MYTAYECVVQVIWSQGYLRWAVVVVGTCGDKRWSDSMCLTLSMVPLTHCIIFSLQF